MHNQPHRPGSLGGELLVMRILIQPGSRLYFETRFGLKNPYRARKTWGGQPPLLAPRAEGSLREPPTALLESESSRAERGPPAQICSVPLTRRGGSSLNRVRRAGGEGGMLCGGPTLPQHHRHPHLRPCSSSTDIPGGEGTGKGGNFSVGLRHITTLLFVSERLLGS